jgi:hypothetical protein
MPGEYFLILLSFHSSFFEVQSTSRHFLFHLHLHKALLGRRQIKTDFLWSNTRGRSRGGKEQRDQEMILNEGNENYRVGICNLRNFIHQKVMKGDGTILKKEREHL